MKQLTHDQAIALIAFMESFDLTTVGAWPAIEKAMQDDWGIEDPEEALADARRALE